MAKMFYSIEEAASRLKKSVDEVRRMAGSGQITEFRDGDRLLFKVDQIDFLAGDDHSAGSGMIPLADTGAGTALGISLADSSPRGAAPAPESSREKSGIPVFDVDELEMADPSAVTQVTETALDLGAGGNLRMESLGSGSGLMDLTRESDDTSLGAQGMLDELYPSEEPSAGGTASSAAASTGATSGLFEGGAGGDMGQPDGPGYAMAYEPYDGPGSGLAGGLALGASVALVVGIVAFIMTRVGTLPSFFTSVGGENAPMVWTGIFAGATLLFTGLGFVLGRKSA